MKGILYFFIFLCSSAISVAQNEAEILPLCQDFNYNVLINGLESLKNKSTKTVSYEWYVVLDREIVNGYFEQIIILKKDSVGEASFVNESIYTYSINLLTDKKNKIVYYKISKEVDYTDIVLKEDAHSSLNGLEKQYQNTFFEVLDFEGLFNTQVVYGSSCGFVGAAPYYRTELELLLLYEDKATLIQWLKSSTVEIQLYGIEGILTLQNAGVKFDEKILQLIDVIAHKKGLATTCSGCFHLAEPIREIVAKIKYEFNAY